MFAPVLSTSPAAGVARAVGALVRRADSRLAYGAALNAASSVADGRARRLEELRTMRDLRALDALAVTAPRSRARR